MPGTVIATGPIGLNFGHSLGLDFLNRIVAVAEPVPFRKFGLELPLGLGHPANVFMP
jgi:hypothetical protein